VREFGAAGVVTFNNATGKPIDRPDQFAWGGIGGRGFGPDAASAKTTFGIILSHRLGMELVELCEKGQAPKVQVKVRATEYEADMQVPTAVIRGSGASEQVIALSGHLFEGIAKQGALDDASGCAAVLEVARVWKKLIDDGVLPRPRRTVRFLWVPEISGTMAYLGRFPEEAKRMVAAISMDMVGEDNAKNRNSLRMMRTPYSVNSYINEVTQQFFEFVGDTNREKVQNRRVAYAYRYPILDPQGSRDQFYYNIEKHYGSSDHSVYLNYGVPAVLFNNWPDIAYHTSEDRPFGADATQLKRAVFIGLASMAVLANADAPGALRIAEMTAGYGAARAGVQLGLALQVLGDKGPYKEAVNLVRQAYEREGDAIRSAVKLAEDPATAAKIEQLASTFKGSGLAADLARLGVYAQAVGVDTNVTLTAEEEAASHLVPVRKKTGPQGFGGGGGMGGNRPTDPAEASRQQYYAMEMRGFADGKRSILDIRNAVSAEYGPLDLARVNQFFENLAKSGEFELTRR
jgi:Zn-dependent M28 family amino/carboxypeptidase